MVTGKRLTHAESMFDRRHHEMPGGWGWLNVVLDCYALSADLAFSKA
jgi:hypothetical protein